MAVTRIVPDITSDDIPRSRAFYRLLGLEEQMDLGWVVTLGPFYRPDVQLLLMARDESASVNPDISIGVDDVDAAHETDGSMKGSRSFTACETSRGASAGSLSETPTERW